MVRWWILLLLGALLGLAGCTNFDTNQDFAFSNFNYSSSISGEFEPIAPENSVPFRNFSISPALPEGLTLNTTTGEITGDYRGYLDQEYTVSCTCIRGIKNYSDTIRIVRYKFPEVFGKVLAMARVGNVLYLGGSFSRLEGQYAYAPFHRSNLAAISATTGEVLAWNPNVDGEVETLSVYRDKLYVGGKFLSINEQTRTRLASFDLDLDKQEQLENPTLNNWAPTLPAGSTMVYDKMVNAIVSDGSTIYVGGSFGQHLPSAIRRFFAAFDMQGNLLAWNPKINEQVRALYIHDGILYVGGDFTKLGPSDSLVDRKRLLAFEMATRDLLDWDPNVLATPGLDLYSRVMSIVRWKGSLIIGGIFGAVGAPSSVRHNLAALDLAQPTTDPSYLLEWNPGVNFTAASGVVEVAALEVFDDYLYVGGDIIKAATPGVPPEEDSGARRFFASFKLMRLKTESGTTVPHPKVELGDWRPSLTLSDPHQVYSMVRSYQHVFLSGAGMNFGAYHVVTGQKN